MPRFATTHAVRQAGCRVARLDTAAEVVERALAFHCHDGRTYLSLDALPPVL